MKVVTRHIWEPYMEKCEDIRHTIGMKEVYAQRKETVERLFGTAKENHGLRYTQMIGKARMEMKVGLTFACMNLKKLAKNDSQEGKVFIIDQGFPFPSQYHLANPKVFICVWRNPWFSLLFRSSTPHAF